MRPLLILGLFGLGLIYTLGWSRLRRLPRTKRSTLAYGWRLGCYWGGLTLIFLSLVSPIDTLGATYFFMHMIQHLLLAMFAPPLLLLGNPMPVMMWGLPMRLRKGFGRILFNKNAPLRKPLTALTNPGIVWFVWVVTLWGWHDADAYSFALRNDFAHDVEHFTFFWTAMFFWWHITGAAPRFHKRLSLLSRFGMAIAAVPPNMVLGVILSFVDQPIYDYYLSVPKLPWLQDTVVDQQIGGVIMWVPGSMMYVIAAIVTMARYLSEQEEQSVEPLRPTVLGM